MKYKLVIFDFDGTLADSVEWFLRAFTQLAPEFHLRPLSGHDRETLRGFEPRQVLEHLGLPLWKMTRVALKLRKLAAQHRDRIKLFPGVDELFHDLRQLGATIAIVSSNSEVTIRHIFGPTLSARVQHFACGASLFGKPAKLRAVLRRSGLPVPQSIYIGDEIRDAQAARQIQMEFGAVAWGYSTPEALLDQSPALFFRRMDEIVPCLGAVD